jgi:hypothetical protein
MARQEVWFRWCLPFPTFEFSGKEFLWVTQCFNCLFIFPKSTPFCGGIATVSRPVWSRKGSLAPASPCSIFHSLGRLRVSITSTSAERGFRDNWLLTVRGLYIYLFAKVFLDVRDGNLELKHVRSCKYGGDHQYEPSSRPWSKDPQIAK